MSRMIERRITKPKLARSCLVKTVVCVRNPGPTAEVAIRKAAPKMIEVNDLVLSGLAIYRSDSDPVHAKGLVYLASNRVRVLAVSMDADGFCDYRYHYGFDRSHPPIADHIQH